NAPQCTTNVNPPNDEKQSFNVNEFDPILPGIGCVWDLASAANKRIQITLESHSSETATQCVVIGNEDMTDAKEICRNEQSNTFTSTGKGVLIVYDGETSQSNSQENFKIHYQFGQFHKSVNFVVIVENVVMLIDDRNSPAHVQTLLHERQA
ncbi:unnamed protein product, partial [Echinostoma caproni]|uniref:CUB domain-containing protein n=1 Tax=Echinostoma caproni TaxID=27848 RepID=A0A183B8Q4_9TREM